LSLGGQFLQAHRQGSKNAKECEENRREHMNHDNGLCAVILAGGQSRRMGVNKAFLEVDGQPLVQRILERVRPWSDEVLLSSNEPYLYGFLGLTVVADRFRGQGPLAGLHAAMLHSSRQLFLLLACDMPGLGESLLRGLVRSIAGFDAAIPRTADGRCHPLCAIYRRTCLPFIEDNLGRRINRVTDILATSRLRVRWVGEAEGGFSASDLVNLNSLEDWVAFSLHPNKEVTPTEL
jgi:molybdopterin-guanine dinucleotide biosynthesis protein A